MKIITAVEAAQLVRTGNSIVISGSGGGHAVPESVLAAVEQRFLDSGNRATSPFATSSVSATAKRAEAPITLRTKVSFDAA
jgi:acyl CoA:acetate/3-ketoacid CoA transferase